MTKRPACAIPLTLAPAQSRVPGAFLATATASVRRAGEPVLRSERPKRWFTGGRGDFFPDLTWENRPADLARSGAPQVLQDAWVATVMAVQQAHGGLRNGSCYHLNLSGAPLVQLVLGEPVELCAGYAGFAEHHGLIQTGFRWRPSKWADWIDASEGARMQPLQDLHCWLETPSFYLDFDGGIGGDDIWPPLIYRRKSTLPRHPRDVRDAGNVLTWANAEARELVGREIVPLAIPIAARAVELFSTFTRGSPEAQIEASAKHRMVMRLGRLLTSERGGLLANPDRAAIAPPAAGSCTL
jgi:hypothetical protein